MMDALNSVTFLFVQNCSRDVGSHCTGNGAHHERLLNFVPRFDLPHLEQITGSSVNLFRQPPCTNCFERNFFVGQETPKNGWFGLHLHRKNHRFVAGIHEF